MQIDLEQIRRHYAALSDEALLDVNRADLTPAAQQCFDAAFEQRGLGKLKKAGAVRAAFEAQPSESDEDESDAAELESPGAPDEPGEAPGWHSDAAQVYSAVDSPGAPSASGADHARSVLDDAGIPCYLELAEIDETTREWRLLVPGHLNMQATSILDRDIFNEEFELQWRAHLVEFSDDELLEMHPEVVFCGLFDRVERAIRTYDEEMERRGLKP
jgi:hypothetical protein